MVRDPEGVRWFPWDQCPLLWRFRSSRQEVCRREGSWWRERRLGRFYAQVLLPWLRLTRSQDAQPAAVPYHHAAWQRQRRRAHPPLTFSL